MVSSISDTNPEKKMKTCRMSTY